MEMRDCWNLAKSLIPAAVIIATITVCAALLS